MSEELEPLSAFAESALAAERRRPAASADMERRLHSRIEATLAAAAVGTAVGVGAGAASAASVTKGAQASMLAKAAAPWIALSFLAGGATGAGIHAAVTSTPSEPAVRGPRVTASSMPSASATLEQPPVDVPPGPSESSRQSNGAGSAAPPPVPNEADKTLGACLLYTSPSPRD